MKTTTLIAAAFLYLMPVYSQRPDNTLAPEEFAEGWELLFDGETLNGWKAYNGDTPESWTVKDNAIYCRGTDGGDDLMTVRSFADFDLKFQWRISEKGNSGVIYRTREGRQWSKPHLTGPEFQVMDDPGEYGKKSTGSLYDMYATSSGKHLNHAMEWNSGRIRVSDNLVTHWVNGVIVVQCQMHSEDWDQAFSISKWKDNPYYGMSPFGHIDFQNHGHEVWYKNIKIRALN
jgi:hypothetical protein